MFVSPAYAQTADGAGAGLMQLLPLVLIFVVFYFLLIRPQQKRAKAHKEMLGALRRGDRIVTNGGVASTVRDAHVRDLRSLVLSDGCAAFRPEVHAAALADLATVSRLVSCAEALAMLERR